MSATRFPASSGRAARLRAVSFACGLLGATPAQAQLIDQGDLSSLFGEAVTTSVTGAPQRVSEVPASMIIISGEELRRQNVTNIAEALRGRAGIDVVRFNAQQYEVSVRGGVQPINPRLLVMVDGHQVYLDHYGMTSWTNLGVTLPEIRQIEIVKGPASALFGFNAASAAINIVTYDPIADRITAAAGAIGTDGERDLSGAVTVRLRDDLGLRLAADYGRADEFAPEAPIMRPRPVRLNVTATAAYQPTSAIALRLHYSVSDSDQNVTGASFTPLAAEYRLHAASADLSADTPAGLLGASLTYNRLHTDAMVLQPVVIDEMLDVSLFVARLQDVIRAGPRDTIRLTGELRREFLKSAPSTTGRIAFDIASGGAMWDHRLSPATAFNLAGRIDHWRLGQDGAIAPGLPLSHADFDHRITAWSANAALMIQPDERSTLRLQVARGVQAPSLINTGIGSLKDIGPGLFSVFVGNPQLAVAPTASGEIGFTRDLPRIGGKFAASVFYTRTTNVIGLQARPPAVTPTGVVVFNTFANLGAFTSSGVEATLAGKAGPQIDWRLDYTFDRTRNDAVAAANPAAAPFAAMTPEHKLGAELGTTRGRWTFNLHGLLRSAVSWPATGRRSGWTAGLNATAGLRLTRGLELFVAGENLTGARFIDNGAVRQDIRGRIGLKVPEL